AVNKVATPSLSATLTSTVTKCSDASRIAHACLSFLQVICDIVVDDFLVIPIGIIILYRNERSHNQKKKKGSRGDSSAQVMSTPFSCSPQPQDCGVCRIGPTQVPETVARSHHALRNRWKNASSSATRATATGVPSAVLTEPR